jgi:hypothetical protein
MKKSSLNAERMSTLLKEVEEMVNSRPITFISDDHTEPMPLTPAHFLIGERPMGLPETEECDANHIDKNKLTRLFKNQETLKASLKQRWIKEYLIELNAASKWFKKQSPIEVGEVVLISDDNIRRHLWPMGVVIEVFPGKDGLIRSAVVRVGRNSFKRPIQRLHRLELKQSYPVPDDIAEITLADEAPSDDAGDLDQDDPLDITFHDAADDEREQPEENRTEDYAETAVTTARHGGENVQEHVLKTRCGRKVRLPQRYIDQ